MFLCSLRYYVCSLLNFMTFFLTSERFLPSLSYPRLWWPLLMALLAMLNWCCPYGMPDSPRCNRHQMYLQEILKLPGIEEKRDWYQVVKNRNECNGSKTWYPCLKQSKLSQIYFRNQTIPITSFSLSGYSIQYVCL